MRSTRCNASAISCAKSLLGGHGLWPLGRSDARGKDFRDTTVTVWCSKHSVPQKNQEKHLKRWEHCPYNQCTAKCVQLEIESHRSSFPETSWKMETCKNIETLRYFKLSLMAFGLRSALLPSEKSLDWASNPFTLHHKITIPQSQTKSYRCHSTFILWNYIVIVIV